MDLPKKSKAQIRAEKLSDRVEAVGRMFFILPYTGIFGGNRVYLHYSNDIMGSGAYGQTELPVFRSMFDLLHWAKHYQAWITRHPGGRVWTAKLLAAREKEILDQLSHELTAADAAAIALKEREATLYWIRNGKDKSL